MASPEGVLAGSAAWRPWFLRDLGALPVLARELVKLRLKLAASHLPLAAMPLLLVAWAAERGTASPGLTAQVALALAWLAAVYPCGVTLSAMDGLSMAGLGCARALLVGCLAPVVLIMGVAVGIAILCVQPSWEVLGLIAVLAALACLMLGVVLPAADSARARPGR